MFGSRGTGVEVVQVASGVTMVRGARTQPVMRTSICLKNWLLCPVVQLRS